MKNVCVINPLPTEYVDKVKARFPEANIKTIFLLDTPINAWNTLKDYVKEHKIDTIIAKGKGAFYAQLVYGPKKILIDPVFYAEEGNEEMKKLEAQRDVWYANDFDHRLETKILLTENGNDKPALTKAFLKENVFDSIDTVLTAL